MSDKENLSKRTYEIDIIGRRDEDSLLKRKWPNRFYKWSCICMAVAVMFLESTDYDLERADGGLNSAMLPWACVFIALAYFFNERLRHARTIKKYRIRVGDMILKRQAASS